MLASTHICICIYISYNVGNMSAYDLFRICPT